MTDPVLYELKGQAAWVTLNRPENHNALGPSLTQALDAALERALQDERARVIVLAAAGRTFCAGLDLKGGGEGFVVEGTPGGLPPFQSLVDRLWHASKPIVGRIQGSAYGGGFALVACCDVALAVPEARFAVTELRFGVPPTTIPLILHHKGLLGPLRPWLLSGRQFGAEQALKYHLLHGVVPPEDLDGAVESWCGEFLHTAPGAFGEARDIQTRLPGLGFSEGLALVTGKLKELMDSEEAREGRLAFAEKRDPRWRP
ncbi:MAG: enoyl-CoA hydratase-related protein [bacterium]